MATHGERSPVEPLLTPTEVAEWLQVPVATLYGWRHRREGPKAMPVGRHLRYARAEVERWLREQSERAR